MLARIAHGALIAIYCIFNLAARAGGAPGPTPQLHPGRKRSCSAAGFRPPGAHPDRPPPPGLRAPSSVPYMGSAAAMAGTTAGPPRNPSTNVCTAMAAALRSEEHTSELQSHLNLVCRLLLEKKKTEAKATPHT